MKPEAYLGIDLGGTGVKAGVFSRSGRMLAFCRRELKPEVLSGGRVEIPADAILAGARGAASEAIGRCRAKILAMSISSQGETFVPVDAQYRPLHNAILWYDSRAVAQAAKLSDALASATGRRRTFDPIMTACKIMWLREHNPGVMRRARRFLLLPDFLACKLTGEVATDPNTAASTGLTGAGGGYDSDVLSAAEIDLAQLAPVMESGAQVCRVTQSAAREWGLSQDTLLVVGTNDQYAGALGAGNCRPGIVSETSGTCLAMVTLSTRQPAQLPPGLLSGRFPIPGLWFVLAYAKTSGLALDWFRCAFLSGRSWEDISRMAASSPPGANGLTVLPHFNGTVSPYPNPAARAAFCNLSIEHTSADMLRALLESLAFSLRENIEFMRRHGFPVRAVRSIGGGARNDLWLQIKADVLGMNVERPAVVEAAVLGAAMLAALGRGDFRSTAEASRRLYRAGKVFRPSRRIGRSYLGPYADYIRIKSLLYSEPAPR